MKYQLKQQLDKAKKYFSISMAFTFVSFVFSCVYLVIRPTDPEVREMIGYVGREWIEVLVLFVIYGALLPGLFYMYRAAKEAKVFDLFNLTPPKLKKFTLPKFNEIFPRYEFITRIERYLLQYYIWLGHTDSKKSDTKIEV